MTKCVGPLFFCRSSNKLSYIQQHLTTLVLSRTWINKAANMNMPISKL